MPMRVEVTPNLLTVGVRLRAANPALARALRRDLRAVVAPIAEEAKARAAEFSTTIPASIVVRSSFTRRSTEVRIVEQASKMPAGHEALPRLQELGSKGGRDVIRHPVFGNRNAWVVQQAHPYLRELVASRTPVVREALMGSMAEAARVAGFGVGNYVTKVSA